MATSGAVTGSVALTELKKDLTELSATLHEIYELMSEDMRNVGEAWQDGKYQEFVDGYRPQINKCEEISERYKEWCMRVLDPTIENVIAVEKTDVGGGGSGSVSGTFGGADATSTGTGSNAVGAGVGGAAAAASKPRSIGRLSRKSYMGNRTPSESTVLSAKSTSGRLSTRTSNPAAGTTSGRSATKPMTSASPNTATSATKPATNTSQTGAKIGDSEGTVSRFPIGAKKTSTQTAQTKSSKSTSQPAKKQSSAQKLFAEADEICKTDNRSDKFRAKLAKPEDADFTLSSKKSETGSSYSLGGEMSGGIKTDVKIPIINKGAEVSADIKGAAEYNSGKETSEISGNYNFKCVEDTSNE